MKNRKLLLIPLLALLLTGCDISSSDVSGSLPIPSENENSSSEGYVSVDVPVNERNNYHRVDEADNYPNRALDEAMEMTALNSLGEQKLLVVPVTFTDYDYLATEEIHDMLERVFFGEASDTGWESVASFYHKSSFGKLTLTGQVLDYYESKYSTAEFNELPANMKDQQMGEEFFWDQTHHMIDDIYNSFDAELLKEYDLDGDGHVDALWMVYIAPISNGAFWAYKFYWNRYPDLDKPTPNVYAWASYEFAIEAYGYNMKKPDAHTFIHETGHMFGLPDYYDYDKKAAPTGRIDMMDNNVIDHNMYSKYLLNWSAPYYVTGHADITLRPAESSGDFILIKDDWNGHAYDEYILLEYYTPTGLNAKDSVEGGYKGYGSPDTLQAMTESGIRMWHVDSRLIQYVFELVDEEKDEWGVKEVGWSDTIIGDDITYTTIGPSNTGSSSYNGEGKEDPSLRLLHLMDATGNTGSGKKNWFRNPDAQASNERALFKTGQKIDVDEWGTYFQHAAVNGVRPATFNDGSRVGYKLEIGEMNAAGVTIKIRKA